jgi:hypothetical protein
MKKMPVIVLAVLGLVFAGMAEAAKPKKRTRNQNRVGPYVTGLVGMTTYGGDHAGDEADLLALLDDTDIPVQNAVTGTDDSDIGYQANFGYRFNRYLAAEIGLAQFGSLTSTLNADVDVPNDNQGFVPATLELSFDVGGPVISAIGILPLSDKFEVFARLGFIFASVEREFSSRVDGQRGVGGSAKGDAQDPLYGVGVAWNINPMYAIRGEYQVLSDVGQSDQTGTEDLDTFAIGLTVRF